MSERIAIDKDVPLPPKRVDLKPRTAKYPFAQMEVGDSFSVPLTGERRNNGYVSATRLTSAAASHKKRNPGWNFAIRTLPEDSVVRIWRTA